MKLTKTSKRPSKKPRRGRKAKSSGLDVLRYPFKGSNVSITPLLKTYRNSITGAKRFLKKAKMTPE